MSPWRVCTEVWCEREWRTGMKGSRVGWFPHSSAFLRSFTSSLLSSSMCCVWSRIFIHYTLPFISFLTSALCLFLNGFDLDFEFFFKSQAFYFSSLLMFLSLFLFFLRFYQSGSSYWAQSVLISRCRGSFYTERRLVNLASSWGETRGTGRSIFFFWALG